MEDAGGDNITTSRFGESGIGDGESMELEELVWGLAAFDYGDDVVRIGGFHLIKKRESPVILI